LENPGIDVFGVIFKMQRIYKSVVDLDTFSRKPHKTKTINHLGNPFWDPKKIYKKILRLFGHSSPATSKNAAAKP